MVIDDFDVDRSRVGPPKADSELVVDSDGVLPFAILLQRMKSVAGWGLQVAQSSGRMDLAQFAPRYDEDRGRHTLGVSAVENIPRRFVREALDCHRIVPVRIVVSLDDTNASSLRDAPPPGKHRLCTPALRSQPWPRCLTEG
jgi:hypothetical protein